MPRKTRQQKKLAEVRRREHPPQTYTFTAPVRTELPSAAPSYSIYIRQDLRKTIFLGGIFILIEFLLTALSAKFGW